MAQAVQTTPVSDTRVARFMAQVYLLMAVGLVITAVVSTWVTTNLELLWKISTNPGIAWGLFLLQIIIVVALSASVMRMNPGRPHCYS
ncbi:MAG: hypothetical protein HC804_07260 [Anaerolineae bacterium]|nr:hypothetical protein [Anaerolineae bacterium]